MTQLLWKVDPVVGLNIGLVKTFVSDETSESHGDGKKKRDELKRYTLIVQDANNTEMH